MTAVDTKAAGLNEPIKQQKQMQSVLTAIGELQQADLASLAITLVDGAAADTNIAVTGITTGDTIVSVIEVVVAADTGTDATGDKVTGLADRTSEADITSAGNIQLDTTNTTGSQLVVFWLNAS